MSPDIPGHLRGPGRSRNGRPQHVKLSGHLNSVAVETMLENLHHLKEVEDIRGFLAEQQPESIQLLESVVELGLETPRQVLYEFALREAETAIQTRRLLLHDVENSTCAVFLPLPPHVVDIVRDRVADLPCFNTEDRHPNHLRELPQQELRGGIFANAFEELRATRGVIIDGQGGDDTIYVRSSVAPLLSSMLDRSLERIYFHRIPHLPPGQEFTHVRIDPSRVNVLYV
jgi:hypothetical protein